MSLKEQTLADADKHNDGVWKQLADEQGPYESYLAGALHAPPLMLAIEAMEFASAQLEPLFADTVAYPAMRALNEALAAIEEARRGV